MQPTVARFHEEATAAVRIGREYAFGEVKMSQNGNRFVGSSGSRNESPAVRCEICGTGIGTAADLAMTDGGPMHIRCQPTHSEADPRS